MQSNKLNDSLKLNTMDHQERDPSQNGIDDFVKVIKKATGVKLVNNS